MPENQQPVASVGVGAPSVKTDLAPATAAPRNNNPKWEAEEGLGSRATISAVLYANIHHPELLTQFPCKCIQHQQKFDPFSFF
jgi:hypothetical protein